MYDSIGTSNFSMTVEGTCGTVDRAYSGTKSLTATEKKNLKRRFHEVEKKDSRGHTEWNKLSILYLCLLLLHQLKLLTSRKALSVHSRV